jgi:CRISPR-associated endonuclease/helicase Cas3
MISDGTAKKDWPDEAEREVASFFKKATGHEPFPYQISLALSPQLPQLIGIHTGAGKTAAVILAWLWRRRRAQQKIRNSTPRRLVYCLPMRVLVEQTRDNAVRWLHNLGLLEGNIQFDDAGPRERIARYEPTQDAPDRIAVSALMGGEETDHWDIYPERDAIIIGTQDMLLSRALNRGFGMSRYRWPLHFGLLNNDCLWVIDEIQLMGEGLPTTAQLQIFRQISGNLGTTRTIWMSATLEPEWLKSADFDPPRDAPGTLSLSQSDRATSILQGRMRAKKPLERACKQMGDPSIATDIIAAHKRGTRTLVVVNTVGRAMELFDTLARKKPGARLVLVHSRFRPPDRQRAIGNILEDPGPEGTIVISTQVIEAGVDLSARLMFTELAPWPSLVQRFGRCNRAGTDKDARIFWMDLPDDSPSREKLACPYDPDQLLQSKKALARCTDASPSSLPKITLKYKESQVIRHKDITELFDTTPDISGHDIDISRFIRDNPDTDAQVFWRDLPESGPELYEKYPGRDELCPVPVSDIRDLLAEGNTDAWAPDPLDGTWTRLGASSPVYPGMTILLPSFAGKYTGAAGWNPKSVQPVPPIIPDRTNDSTTYDEDPLSQTDWASLMEHSDAVVGKMQDITSDIEETMPWRAGTTQEKPTRHSRRSSSPSFCSNSRTLPPQRPLRMPGWTPFGPTRPASAIAARSSATSLYPDFSRCNREKATWSPILPPPPTER